MQKRTTTLSKVEKKHNKEVKEQFLLLDLMEKICALMDKRWKNRKDFIAGMLSIFDLNYLKPKSLSRNLLKRSGLREDFKKITEDTIKAGLRKRANQIRRRRENK